MLAPDRKRYYLQLRHGWPIVLNLLIIQMFELVLGHVLRYNITPFDWLMPPHVADFLWDALGWAAFVVVVALYVTGHTTTVLRVTVAIMVLFTAGLVMNVAELARSLANWQGSDASRLLLEGGLIWLANMLLFTTWYWLLDGGDYLRRAEGDWAPRDFLFPPQSVKLADYPHWHPHYVDYLFLAFCTSTALSPADTATLSRHAKALQMLQALLSLAVISLVIARAINILSGPSPAPGP